MDKKRIDRIVREEVAALLEMRQTIGGRIIGRRDRDSIERLNPTTGFALPSEPEEKDWDEPDDRTPEEIRQDRERMRAARDAEQAARSAAYRASQPKQKTAYSRHGGNDKNRTVSLTKDDLILPPAERYDFVQNPANSDGVSLTDVVRLDSADGRPRLMNYASVEFDADSGMWKVSGMTTELKNAFEQPLVGTGPSVREAYLDMLSQVLDRGIQGRKVSEPPSPVSLVAKRLRGGGAEPPLSESRWAQLAGLMTEGKRSKVRPTKKGEAQKLFVDDEDGEPILYMGPAGVSYRRAMEAKGKLRKVTPGQALAAMKDDPDMAAEASGTDDREEIMGHLDAMSTDRNNADKLKRGVRPMPEPVAVDEGSGAAPGSDPKRLPKPPNPKKDGPPGKEDLDAIKKLGPFERKKR